MISLRAGDKTIELEPLNMGEMEDHESEINTLLEKDGLTASERVKLGARLIAKIVKGRFPEIDVELVRRALPYGKVLKFMTALITAEKKD